MSLNLIQSILVTLLIFVPPRTRRTCMFWFTRGPLVSWISAHIVFVGIPILSILWWLAMWTTTTGWCFGSNVCEASEIRGWFFTYAFMSVLMCTLQYFVIAMLIGSIAMQYEG